MCQVKNLAQIFHEYIHLPPSLLLNFVALEIKFPQTDFNTQFIQLKLQFIHSGVVTCL